MYSLKISPEQWGYSCCIESQLDTKIRSSRTFWKFQRAEFFALLSRPPQNHISSACRFSCPHSLVVPKTPCHHPRPGHACVEPPHIGGCCRLVTINPTHHLGTLKLNVPMMFKIRRLQESIKKTSPLLWMSSLMGSWQCGWLVKTCQNSHWLGKSESLVFNLLCEAQFLAKQHIFLQDPFPAI